MKWFGLQQQEMPYQAKLCLFLRQHLHTRRHQTRPRQGERHPEHGQPTEQGGRTAIPGNADIPEPVHPAAC